MFVAIVRAVPYAVAHFAKRYTSARGALVLLAFGRRVNVHVRPVATAALLLVRLVAAVVGFVAHPALRNTLPIVASELTLETVRAIVFVVVFRTILDTIASASYVYTGKER